MFKNNSLSFFVSLALLITIVLISSVVLTTNADDKLSPTIFEPLAEEAKQSPQLATKPEQQERKTLTQSQIIDQATSQSADAHIITKNKDGSIRIPSPLQDVIATLTPNGVHIYSDDKAGETFSLRVNNFGRDNNKLTEIKQGRISHTDKIARLYHKSLIEEFTTSSAGIRQDFVIPQAPQNNNGNKGKLTLTLEIEGANAKLNNKGVILTLKSGRELAYHNLLVADATGKSLPAHFELNDDSLRIIVDDTGAKYPVRIDPTITDADWFSLGTVMPAPDNHVRAVVADGSGSLYIGGRFSTLKGVANTAHIAKWDGSTWSALGSGVNGDVKALAFDGSNLYAGGYFTNAGGVAANYIAKWDGSTWSPLASGMNDPVSDLAWDGTGLYAGGAFNNAGGVPNTIHIARWDGSTWSALGSGISGDVVTLAWDGANLYAGGLFSSAGYESPFTYSDGSPIYYNVDVSNIAMWDGSSWSALGSGASSLVYALVHDGTNLYAGGAFTTAGGVNANHIAMWDGSIWSPLGSGMDGGSSCTLNFCNGWVFALAHDGTHLYASGNFISAGGVSANYIAKWDGIAWSSLGSGMNERSYALAYDGTSLYAGGAFTTAGDSDWEYITQWDGSNWNSLGAGMNGLVTTTTWDGSNLYAGGYFTTAGEVSVNHIAKWNGSTWSALGFGMNALVNTLTSDGSNLYAGGLFTSAGGVSANYIAMWNGSSWSPLGAGMNLFVNVLAYNNGNLYAGGQFTSAGGLSANHIAKWDGSIWNALGSGVSNVFGSTFVRALVFGDNNLYAGGNFTSAGGGVTSSIAKWDGSTWSALGSGVSSAFGSAFVGALAFDGSSLYAGGNFDSAGGVTASSIAKWDGSTWSALGLGVSQGPISGNPSVSALAFDGSKLYVGGFFDSAGGVEANNIAKWDGSAWSALGSGVNGQGQYVDTLTYDGTNLYAGGNIRSAGDKAVGYIAGVQVVSTTPDKLAFADVVDAAFNSLITSEVLSISGVIPGLAISISGGEYSLNGNGFTSASGTTNNGDTLQLRTTSSASYISSTDVIVSIGDGGTTWSVITRTNTVPDVFSFSDQNNTELNTLIASAEVVISGLGASSPVTIIGGEYSINGGSYTSIDGFVNDGDKIILRTLSASNGLTSIDVVFTIGGVNDTFTVTTEVDTDGDGIGNTADADDDNDGLSDTTEAILGTDSLLTDTDGDGLDDKADAFPIDGSETIDSDGDGVGNNIDAFPNNSTETTDSDSDGVGDNADAFPNNIAASVDANANGQPDEWNADCDITCQKNSGMTLDILDGDSSGGNDSGSSSGGSSGGGSINPLAFVVTLLIPVLRRRV